MEFFNKYQTGVIFSAVIIGLLVGKWGDLSEVLGKLIVPFLMAMLMGLFLGLDFIELKYSFKNTKFLTANLIVNFIWTPIFAYILGWFFLKEEWFIAMGFVMLMVTPCTDWYLVFTGIAKGNVPLATSVLPINLILQVVLLPVYLMVFFGESGQIQMNSLLESMFLILVIPFLIAYFVKKWKKPQNSSIQPLFSFFEKSQVLFLALAVLSMFASEGQNLLNTPQVLLKLLIPIFIFFAFTYVLIYFVSRILKFKYADRVSLTFTTMARNSPIALAIAVTAFSYEPIIALSLIIGPLLELPILLLTTQLLKKSSKLDVRAEPES